MVGIDVVDVERLRETLAATPRLAERLFTATELEYATARTAAVVHLAGMLAAKEATVKALGSGGLARWAKRIEIRRDVSGRPFAIVDDGAAMRRISISISHDGGIATAVAFTAYSRHSGRTYDAVGAGTPPLILTSQMDLRAR